MKIKNHYVPQTYLKQWSINKRVFEYNLLVSHQDMPKWKDVSISRTSSIDSLYLYYDNGELTDEMEDYFSEKFETQYTPFVNKINSYSSLDKNDFEYISKLIASQSLRTIAGFIRIQKIVRKKYPEIVDEVLKKMERELKDKGTLARKESNKIDELIPLEVNLYEGDEDKTQIEVTSHVGKSMWLYAMKHLLNQTYKVLDSVSWSIYDAPPNFSWVTTDDPVIFLNYYGVNHYDFEGGWAVNNTNIIFPISPKKLLFAQIGTEQDTYKVADYVFANRIQNYIVEHAFSKIYSDKKNHLVTKLRKRKVDKELFNEFNSSIKKMHDNYLEYEVPYLNNRSKKTKSE